MKRKLLFPLTIVILLAAITGLAYGFAEEKLGFRNPDAPLTSTSTEEVSTIHTDLTYVLAVAAGFRDEDALTLSIWDQLVDSENLTFAGVVKYSNCLGTIPTAPSHDAACGSKLGTSVIWPLWSLDTVPNASQTCATSRFGPFSPFFHFPVNNAEELGALHDWGWGITNHLMGYAAYAWGLPTDQTVVRANCRVREPMEIDTGIEAGSLPAFATYLHSLGDAYSHRECNTYIQTLNPGNAGPLWGTHTQPYGEKNACTYDPSDMNASDVHGVEFGTVSVADSNRTVEAAQAIYAELTRRSLQREGNAVPLSGTTELTLTAGTMTLDEAVDRFVHQWTYDQPQNRRDFADDLLAAVKALPRDPIARVYLPNLAK